MNSIKKAGWIAYALSLFGALLLFGCGGNRGGDHHNDNANGVPGGTGVIPIGNTVQEQDFNSFVKQQVSQVSDTAQSYETNDVAWKFDNDNEEVFNDVLQ